MLLEECEGQFKSKPEVRNDIGLAIQKMVQLQNEVARLYGPTFSIRDHISRYIRNKNAFIDNLPPVVANMTPEYFEARDRDIRELLRSARLPLLVLRRMGCHRFVCPGERKNFIFSKIVAASLMVLSMKKSLPGSASMNPVRRQFYVQTAK